MFLRNFWYVAAWSHEVERRPLGRLLLNEPVVFFRKIDGTPIALEDHCPHRGFPLSKGQLIEDNLQCGYHGITFDCSGRCIRVPGQPQIPSNANIRTYPIIERWGLVWIWMGDPTRIDPARVPNWSFLDNEDWFARGEHLHVASDYRLILDNLLDLTHIAFVHPRTLGSITKLDEVQVENEITADAVTNSRWLIDIAPPPTYARGNFRGNVDRWQITRFQPPAFASLDAGAAATGTGTPQGDFSNAIGLRTYNAMTPETEKSTHYFWMIAQQRKPQDPALADSIFHDIQKTVQEDIAVFEAHQKSLDLKPDRTLVTIKSDAALIAARRIIDRFLEAERNE